ncbi:MAG: hypothetical protein Q3976_04100 [Corynebacterium sp.]|nr:hypothetical protein [Corynebacterium sp.]
MVYTRWERNKDVATLVDAAGTTLATVPQPLPEQATVTTTDGSWEVTYSNTELRSEAADATVSMVASAEKPWRNAKEVELRIGTQDYKAINEARNDWVYVAGDTKVGQFSGSGNGVRAAITEFEEDASLDTDARIFFSLVTRTILEARLRRTQLAWTSTMVIMTIAIILTLI